MTSSAVGGGTDHLYGEAGDDILFGGTGTDYHDGGADFDYCENDNATYCNALTVTTCPW